MFIISKILSSLIQFKGKSLKKSDVLCVVDNKKLPSQGVFYKKDFIITLNIPSSNDILNLNKSFETVTEKDYLNVADIMKEFLAKNITFSKKYCFEDILAIDITMIFIIYYQEITHKPFVLNGQKMSPENFIYFDFSLYKKYFIPEERVFEINEFKFKPPTLKVENALYKFIDYIISTNDEKLEYLNADFNFIFFLNDSTKLSNQDIINLIDIFTDDLSDMNKLIIENIISKFSTLIKYSFIGDNGEVQLLYMDDIASIRI